MKYEHWQIPAAPEDAIKTLMDAGYPYLVSSVLAARGVQTSEQAAEALEREASLTCSPFLMKDMDKAVSRISKALESGEKIAVFGDYDVDGITSTCLLSPWLGLAVQMFWCGQALAAKGLAQESMNVHKELVKGDLPAARKAVSRIVGRDTQNLTAEGVTKAAVETVAENASDGVIAPLLYMLIGGAPLALTYKAINTMDSMLGYKNEKYLYFGRIPAKLDDAANYLPSRLAGLLWCAAAALTGNSAKGAWRIWRRDRRNHASPNSAQTESACAGALGVQLAGPAYYFGEYYPKPTIGDAMRPIEPEDIRRANKMMYAESLLALLLGLAIRGVILPAAPPASLSRHGHCPAPPAILPAPHEVWPRGFSSGFPVLQFPNPD